MEPSKMEKTSSSFLTKLFNPLGVDSKSTPFKNSLERKVYEAASLIFGALTLGVGHGIYGLVKLVQRTNASDPDKKNVEIGIKEEKIGGLTISNPKLPTEVSPQGSIQKKIGNTSSFFKKGELEKIAKCPTSEESIKFITNLRVGEIAKQTTLLDHLMLNLSVEKKLVLLKELLKGDTKSASIDPATFNRANTFSSKLIAGLLGEAIGFNGEEIDSLVEEYCTLQLQEELKAVHNRAKSDQSKKTISPETNNVQENQISSDQKTQLFLALNGIIGGVTKGIEGCKNKNFFNEIMKALTEAVENIAIENSQLENPAIPAIEVDVKKIVMGVLYLRAICPKLIGSASGRSERVLAVPIVLQAIVNGAEDIALKMPHMKFLADSNDPDVSGLREKIYSSVDIEN
jgi:hypothetical protein